jgi:hypothetical protein
MIYGELVDPIPSEKIPAADDLRDGEESGETPRPHGELKLRVSEIAGAVGSRQALRMLRRVERTS